MGEKTDVNEICAFWDSQAEKHKANLEATTPDPLAKELELNVLKKYFDTNENLLDIGCGNGFNLFSLVDTFRGKMVGVDFATKMIEAAKRECEKRTDRERFAFHEGSVLDDLSYLGQHSQIYTDRCLINLTSDQQHIDALHNLASLLKPGGKLVLIESTRQGQEKINSLRELSGLDSIPYHWHNLYLDENSFLSSIPDGIRHLETDNFASLYFFMSRVINAKLTPEGQAPDYLSEINKLGAHLPSFGDIAPLKAFIFQKEK